MNVLSCNLFYFFYLEHLLLLQESRSCSSFINVLLALSSWHWQQPALEFLAHLCVESTRTISGQLPTRTIPHRVDIGPDEWLYQLILVWWGVVLGIVVLVGNSWALFLSGGESSPVGSCPRTIPLSVSCSSGMRISLFPSRRSSSVSRSPLAEHSSRQRVATSNSFPFSFSKRANTWSRSLSIKMIHSEVE